MERLYAPAESSASPASRASRGSEEAAAARRASRAAPAAGPMRPSAQAARWATDRSAAFKQPASTVAADAASCPDRPRSVIAQYETSGWPAAASSPRAGVEPAGGGPSSSSAATAHSRTWSSAQARMSGTAAAPAAAPARQSSSAASARWPASPLANVVTSVWMSVERELSMARASVAASREAGEHGHACRGRVPVIHIFPPIDKRLSKGEGGQWHIGERSPSGADHEEQQPGPIGLDAVPWPPNQLGKRPTAGAARRLEGFVALV